MVALIAFCPQFNKGGHQTPTDTTESFIFLSYLEELKEHVIKVGGHVHDADRRVLLTCGETQRLFIRATFQNHPLQTLRAGPSGAIIPSWKGSVNIVRCTWHLAPLELQRYNSLPHLAQR